MRKLRISSAHGSLSFELLLLDGAEPAALAAAVAARAGLRPSDTFYLSAPDDPAAVVPLTTALPDNLLHLCLHLSPHRAVHPPPPAADAAPHAPHAPAAAPPRGLSLPASAPPTPSPPAAVLPPAPSPRATAPSFDLSPPAAAPSFDLSPPAAATAVAPSSSAADSSGAPPPAAGGADPLAAAVSLEIGPPLTQPLLSACASAPVGGEAARASSRRESREGKRPSLLRRLSLVSDGGRLSESEGTKAEVLLEGLERFNRLSTDLANERTLLAWIRTCLAAMRTAFAMLTIREHTTFGVDTLNVAELGMVSFIILSAISGAWRYHKIKSIISLKVPPLSFGRLSLRPLNLLVCLAAAIVAVVIYSGGWLKSGDAP
ncbi:hypothetical protein AB1Y20_012546 [Prymnesium parvum]|uniref:DUF202 domain-containing protein n=1 Tax=Prymnesium parvum TaxID=97485 RepID=A0AB34IIQ3_PRYPA